MPEKAKNPVKVEILNEELNTFRNQFNHATRSLKIGDVYAEIALNPENRTWAGQRGNTLWVLHPKHGEVKIKCPQPTGEIDTYDSEEQKTQSYKRALDEMTKYLQEWVQNFVAP